MSPPVDPRVLDKIKKCLALTASSSPGEAASAMARAQELMARYNVSEAALEEPTVGAVERGEQVRSVATATRVKGWELALFRAVGTVFGCEVLFRGAYPYGYYLFVGFKEETEVARYTVVVLQRQLSRARATFTRDLDPLLDRRTKTGLVDGYCAGWVRGASERVKTLRDARVKAAQAQDAAHGTSTALVVLSAEEKRLRALEEFMKQFQGKGVALNRDRRSAGSYEAERRGYVDGQRASVNESLKTPTTRGDLR
jgi:hypothetical protein